MAKSALAEIEEQMRQERKPTAGNVLGSLGRGIVELALGTNPVTGPALFKYFPTDDQRREQALRRIAMETQAETATTAADTARRTRFGAEAMDAAVLPRINREFGYVGENVRTAQGAPSALFGLLRTLESDAMQRQQNERAAAGERRAQESFELSKIAQENEQVVAERARTEAAAGKIDTAARLMAGNRLMTTANDFFTQSGMTMTQEHRKELASSPEFIDGSNIVAGAQVAADLYWIGKEIEANPPPEVMRELEAKRKAALELRAKMASSAMPFDIEVGATPDDVTFKYFKNGQQVIAKVTPDTYKSFIDGVVRDATAPMQFKIAREQLSQFGYGKLYTGVADQLLQDGVADAATNMAMAKQFMDQNFTPAEQQRLNLVATAQAAIEAYNKGDQQTYAKFFEQAIQALDADKTVEVIYTDGNAPTTAMVRDNMGDQMATPTYTPIQDWIAQQMSPKGMKFYEKLATFAAREKAKREMADAIQKEQMFGQRISNESRLADLLYGDPIRLRIASEQASQMQQTRAMQQAKMEQQLTEQNAMSTLAKAGAAAMSAAADWNETTVEKLTPRQAYAYLLAKGSAPVGEQEIGNDLGL